MAAVTPLAVFKRTPGTNCGQCGRPTCLAFGVAVATTGADPSQCPYIDLVGFDLGEATAKGGKDPNRERELALVAHLQGKIASLDFSIIAGSLGAVWEGGTPDELAFPYLGQAVRLAKSGILLDGVPPEDPRDAILLYNYVHGAGGRPPDQTWVGMESLPNSISKVRTLATYCEQRLARLFAGQTPAAIVALGEPLGARPGPGTATVELIVPVLPMVPQYVLFWDEEPADGFEARVKVLFDRHVLDFLDIESLLFAAERMAERFERLAADKRVDS